LRPPSFCSKLPGNAERNPKSGEQCDSPPTQSEPRRESMSEYRVEKRRVKATLVLATGSFVEGNFFLADTSPHHAGPERLVELLNGSSGFLPFEVDDGGARVALYNRAQIALVRLAEMEIESQFDPSYSLAPRKSVSMLLATGAQITGDLHIVLRSESARLSDYATLDEPFRYLETTDTLYVVNFAHVVEITPLAE
jgi:hypothetical protein